MISMNWSEIFSKLKSSPLWVKIVAVLVVAAIAAVSLFTSCSTIRVIGNDGGVSTTVRQSALDSMQVKVEFTPNVTKYGNN